MDLFEWESDQSPYQYVIDPETGRVWVIARSAVELSEHTKIVDYRVQLVGEEWLSSNSQVSIPTSFMLYPCYPNPFNSTTTIKYALPSVSQVSLILYNLSGQRVKTLVNGRLQAGIHRTILDAGNLASGLYFVKLEVPGKSLTRKIMLVK